MLYLVGLGLGDVKDITVRGLEVVRAASRVYLEAYTSILTVGKDALEQYYGRAVILADRDMVEQNSDEILAGAGNEDVAFLVVGDPFGATTHSDLVLRATQQGIPYRTIHNASIMNAVGCCGLQLYNFGETVSLVFWTDTWRPESYYDKICKNMAHGWHTLCLLDIKVKEQSIENLMKGRKIYEPPRYMSVSQAAEQLLEIIKNRQQNVSNKTNDDDDTSNPGDSQPDSRGAISNLLDEHTLCVGLARIGSETQVIKSGTLVELASCDLGMPLHSLIVTGHTHPLELDMLKLFAIHPDNFERFSSKP